MPVSTSAPRAAEARRWIGGISYSGEFAKNGALYRKYKNAAGDFLRSRETTADRQCRVRLLFDGKAEVRCGQKHFEASICRSLWQ